MPRTECFMESPDVRAYRPVDLLSVGSFVESLEDTFGSGTYFPRARTEDRLRIPCCRLFALDSFRQPDKRVRVQIEGYVDPVDLKYVSEVYSRFPTQWNFRFVADSSSEFEFSISPTYITVRCKSPVDQLAPIGIDDFRINAINRFLHDSDLGQISEIGETRIGPVLAVAKALLTQGDRSVPMKVESYRPAVKLLFRNGREEGSWVEAAGWKFVKANFGAVNKVRCTVGLPREEYDQVWEELNGLWPFGWNISFGYEKECAYDSPDRPFDRPSFATNETPVRLPVLSWQGEEKGLRAEVVHTADESFPELVLSGTEAQQKQMLKKTGYKFERWDGPMVDRWT